MATTVSTQLARMGYDRARRLLGLAGLVILAVLVTVLMVRSVDQTEVIATLLFVPIFLLLLVFGLPGGLAAAALSTVVYVFMRVDAIDAVGWGEFSGLVISRGVAYFLFGAVGGWAAGTLESSLDKLDLYDQIDDRTGLKNARFLLHDVDLERARAERYQTLFSVVFLELAAGPFRSLPTRRRRSALSELGRKLEDAVRSMDRVAHGYDGDLHRIAVVLPETAAGGAATFARRLEESVHGFLTDRGVEVDGVVARALTLPGHEAELEGHLAEWRQIDQHEHSTSPGSGVR